MTTYAWKITRIINVIEICGFTHQNTSFPEDDRGVKLVIKQDKVNIEG